jgi:5-methylcytosine-specific restriction enzyme subunit McrC
VTTVTVREHARLTVGPVTADSLDVASVSASAFDWLCRESARHSGAAPLVQVEDRRWLRLDNYVGVLETPCGTRIEILPKHVRGPTDVNSARRVLIRMLRAALDLPVRESGPTALETFHAPVSEWIIGCFLKELNELVRRGLRFDYQVVEDEVRFLRGRLLVDRQIRQPAHRRHLFQVEHQVYNPNLPENRLIAAALAKVASSTRDPANWRLAHELEHQLAEIRPSLNVPDDFRRWRDDRLMQHYRGIRTWCELILGDRNPMSALGEWTGLSLLFPMERVFERYVERTLSRSLPEGARLRLQASDQSLCHQGDRPMFRLRPDFLVEYQGGTWIIDAKWKLLDGADASINYGISQADFYQMFAYAHRYLRGHGSLLLVYPSCESFTEPLPHFDFGNGIRLQALPLGLEMDQLPQRPWLDVAEVASKGM